MLRIIILLSGFLLLLLQQYVWPLQYTLQFIIFLSGILLLGVPHGAADFLVASQTAGVRKKSFSVIHFFLTYLGRLFLFALTLWYFPVAGMVLFVLFAAFHFGETDLYQFKTNTLAGKFFVLSYGLLILSIILLHHFPEVLPLFKTFEAGRENVQFINWLNDARYNIISYCGIFFFTATFIYFLLNRKSPYRDKGEFLVRFAAILFILFNLPMLLGFTFYFVVWHSVLSLRNILTYLKSNSACTNNTIARQMGLYSLLAIFGIAVFGFAGFMFINKNAIVGYLFLGLAVLTAPHMQIMHDMYTSLRQMRLRQQ